MKIKTRITSMLSVIVMLISMMSFFVLPISVANAESYAGDAAYATGLTDTTSFTAFSSTGAQKIIDLHYSELNEKNDVYRLATVAEAEAAAKDTRFTPTAHFLDYYQKPFTGYRWKMEAGNYKIESVEDMKLLAELSNCGVSFKGVVFYQAADLDFEWEPFRGICIGHSMIGRIMHNSTTKEIGGVSTSVFSEAIRTANAVRPFNGTYDGNGFIIENFYLVSNDAGNVGLFGWVYDGAVIKNVGIASGFIAGQECVGAIAGETNTSKFYNCWSAATVWGNGTNGVGGLIGRLTGEKTALHNCYNLGMVFQYDAYGAGLIGWQNNGSVKNSYNWGQVINGIDLKNLKTHSVIMRKNTTHNPNGSKLYYRNDCINSGTSWAEAKKVNSSYASDNAVGVDATAANVAMLCGASYLNSGISSANASGWTVKYQDLGVGYPVLTYTKDGQTISRVARTDMIGENHWGAQDDCALMKLLYEINVEHVGLKGRLDHVEIHTANDLFVLGLLTTFSKPNIASISIEADIDMDTEFTLLRGLKTYVPLYSGYRQGVNFSSSVYGCTPDIKVTDEGFSGSKAGIETSDGYALYCAGGLEVVASLNIPFDGKYHEVSNWNAYEMGRFCNRGGALISRTSKGALIKNLGLINASIKYDATRTIDRIITYQLNYDANNKTYSVADNGTYSISPHNYTYASLLVGLGYNVIMENCFTTGEIEIVNTRATTANNDSGLVARTWSNGGSVQDCWTDCTIKYPGKEAKHVRAIGSAYAEDTYSDVYVADTAWSGTPAELPSGYLIYNNVYYIGDSVDGSDGAGYWDPLNPVKNMPYVHIDEASGGNGKKYNIDLAYFFNYQMKQKFMFTYNESDGTIHFAKPLKENGNNVINEETGHTVFSNPTRKILYALTSPEGEWICAMDYQYANAGTTVTRKNLGTTPHTGFTFNQAVSSLAENNVVQYDEDPIVAYAATDSKTAFDLFMTYYSTIEGDLDVFENMAQHRYVYQMAKNIDEISDETKRAARIEEMMPILLAYKKQASLEIKDKYFYPQYPNYLPYGMSADLGGNFALVYHKNNYAITNVADWNRLVANCNGTTNYLKNYTFHLTDDIVGTSEEPVESVAPYFNGVLDGHGFTITVDIDEVHTTGKDNGLIVQVGETGVGAIIKNLGLKGSVNVQLDSGVTSGDYGIGALAGTSSADAKLIGCWNEATVTVTLAEGVEQTASNCNTSVGGLVGRWYGQIYDCYNVGAVTGLGRASGICNWMNGADGVVYNVFNSGTLTKSATDKIDIKTNVIYRGGNVAADTALSNIYALEGTTEELANSYTTVGTSRMVAAATYSSGELAYLLNSGKKNYTAERTYFTLNDENQTVLGPAETQIRKIIVKDSNGTVTSTKYGAQGSDYSVGSGTVYKTNKNHYTNGSFIVPNYDLTLTAASQASLSQYISLYNYWNGKRAAYFDVEAKTDLTYADFETQIRSLETAYNNGLVNVTSMAALELDAMTTLQGQYQNGDVGMPHAYLAEAHPDAPVGYRIHSAEDMHALAEYTAIFNAARASGKETILKMVNNVDMALYAGEPFYINGLDATFDGNNKTIFNFTYENLDKDKANIGPALFRGYKGSGISNLTIDGLLVSGGYAAGGLLGNNYSQYVQLNNVTMRNSRVRKAFVAKEDELAMGMLVGRIEDNGGTSSIKDCVVEDCILDFTLYEQPDGGNAMINVGFITGQTYENTILDGVVCQNNTILLNGHEKDKLGSVGYLVGEAYLDSGETLNVRNTTVYGNNTITDPLVTDEADMLYGLEANTKQNQYKYGEVLGWLKTQGAVQISNVQIAGNDANAKSGRSPMLVSVSQDSDISVTVKGELIYWDKNNDPVNQPWYIDPSGTRMTATNAKVHNYETTDFFKYGRSGWEANNDIINSVNTLEADANLRKWTVVHSDTYRDSGDLADLPYPSLVKSGEEPIHQLHFSDVVGTDSDWDNVKRYSDSAKMLIVTVDEIDNPDAEINNIPWDGCIGNMKNYVPENLNGDITINSIPAQYAYNNLSLDTDIGVNFWVQIHPDFRDGEKYKLTTTHSLTWKDSFSLNTAEGDASVVTIEEDAKRYYRIKLPLNANEMWRSFWVQLTDKNSNDTATYIGRNGNVQQENQKWTTYSNVGYIKNYVQAILQNKENREDYAAAQNLAAAMLNYGNEVRDRFWLGGNDRPWIDELKDFGYPLYGYTNMEDNDFSDKKVTTNYKETFTPYKSTGSRKTNPLTYVGTSLVFDTNVGLRHYFKLNETASQDGVAALNEAYDAAVRTLDGTLIADLEYRYNAEQNMYYVEYADIAAQDMDEMYLFTFSQGTYDVNNNYVVKLKYGVFSYGYVSWNKLTVDKFVTAAMYEYCKEAEAYLAAV